MGLKLLTNNEDTKKAVVLYFAMIAGILFGFGISVINTRFLSVVDYGKFKFIQQLFTLTATIVAFGFAYSVGRLVTRASDSSEQLLVGATVVIHIVLTVLAACTIFIFSFFVDNLFNTNIASYIRLVVPFVFVGIFTGVLENLLQGMAKIYSLAIFRVTPRLLYIVAALFAILSAEHFSLSTALLLYFGTASIIISLFIWALRPKFLQLGRYFNDIWLENKRNGFHVYTGSLCNVAIANLIGIALGYYADMEAVGYYSLALIVSTPLQFLPSVIGTTLFKSFATQPRIQGIAIIGAVLPALGSLVIFLLVIKHIIALAYSEKYLSVVPYTHILAFGMILNGMGDFFNRFLGAHARGKDLRNVAIVTGLFLLFGSFILLPIFGIYGAVWTQAGSSLIYFLGIYYYYRKFIAHTKR